jgi:hypothetical protein
VIVVFGSERDFSPSHVPPAAWTGTASDVEKSRALRHMTMVF